MINIAKSLNDRMKIKNKQKKKKTEHPLFPILNQLIYTIRHHYDQYTIIVN